MESSLKSPVKGRQRSLSSGAAGAVWVVNALFWFAALGLSMPVYFRQAVQLNTSAHGSRVDPAALRAGLEGLGLSTRFYAVYSTGLVLLFALTYITVGALIFWKKSADPMAFRVSIWMVIFGASFPPAVSYLPQALPAAGWPGEAGTLALTVVRSLSFTFFFLLLYIFPDGRFVPGWTVIPAALFLFLSLIAAIFPNTVFDTSSWPFPYSLLVMLLFFATMVFAQVYRYRHVSNPVQRQQTKWVMFGMLVAVSGFVLGALGLELSRIQGESNLFTLALDLLYGVDRLFSFVLLPLALGISILRYRLYDIDLIVNRTLVYAVLTAMLGLLYFGSVVLLQTGFQIATGQEESVPVVTVLSTLVIAAMFGPLRQRVQEMIDRRFYRQRYDAARELSAFSASLRDELDLNQLCQRLLTAVEDTMQPEQVSLWLIRKANAAGGENASSRNASGNDHRTPGG
jgi:hypothetical protein